MTPLRAVLDTNVLLVSLSPGSQFHWVFRAITEGRVVLCLSTGIALEYEEVVANHMGRRLADRLTSFLDDGVSTFWVHPSYRWRLVAADPDDDKFVDCAVAAGALLVTEDRHFDPLRDLDFPPVEALGLDAFRRRLG